MFDAALLLGHFVGFFFFNDTATTEIYTLSLHDALPIFFLILKSGVNHTSRGSISTSTLPSIKLRKCSSKIITSILSFISGRLATKSNQIKERILVIILLLHFLSLMLGSVLVLMLPLDRK